MLDEPWHPVGVGGSAEPADAVVERLALRGDRPHLLDTSLVQHRVRVVPGHQLLIIYLTSPIGGEVKELRIDGQRVTYITADLASGMPLGEAVIAKFSDGEIQIEILENVRGKDVFVIQPTCAPTNDNFMELVMMLDALKRASAQRITAVVPYFGYARQDRRPRSARVPISAKVCADMIGECGANRVLTVDLHADQIQGFFDIPVDNVYASPVLLGEIWRQKYDNVIVVAPDVGGVVRARAVAKRLDDAELAIIDKRRPKPNESRVMNIIGDVSGRTCVLVDDLVDTAGTLCKAAAALKDEGAVKVVAYVTHPVFSGAAVTNTPCIKIEAAIISPSVPHRLYS